MANDQIATATKNQFFVCPDLCLSGFYGKLNYKNTVDEWITNNNSMENSTIRNQ